MSSDEITRGVIFPYMLTSLAPRLSVHVKFEVPLKWGEVKGKKMDAVLFDNEYATELAHVEYENNYVELLDEISKFHNSRPTLKVLITIPDLESGTNKEEFNEWVDKSLSPIIFHHLKEKPDRKWLLIYSEDLDIAKWRAMKFEIIDGLPKRMGLA